MAWTLRLSQPGHNNLNAYDSVGAAAGNFTARITWPSSCANVNQGAMVALPASGLGAVTWLQGKGNAAPNGTRSTWPTTFDKATLPGSTLVVVVGMTASSGTAGPVTVTDTQGNVYTAAIISHPPFQGYFLGVFVAANTAGGAGNTVTVAIGGAFPFDTITVELHEYAGLTGGIDATSYGSGALFGVGNLVELALTTTAAGALLFLATDSLCSGVVAQGGGDPIPGPAPVPPQTGVPPPTNLAREPNITINLVDPATGLTNVQWWRYWKALGRGLPFTQDFTALANVPLAIKHGRNSLGVVVQLWDANGLELVAPSCVRTDANTLTLTFGQDVTGTVVVIG